jgi:phosphotransferase system enzyme I (PtsI)
VAKGLEIPAVVGTGLFLADVNGGDVVIVDGDHGQVIVKPDDETLNRYRKQAEHQRTVAIHLATYRDLPSQTVDGERVSLCANIEFPPEVDSADERGADGIGLYRTEFLYLGAQVEPNEETHFEAYVRVAKAMGDRPVVIRTLDLGADKMGMVHPGEEEHNPFLGLRSIRLSLRNLALFRTQLRAALRASAQGNIRLMFPLVTTLHELRSAKMLLADVMEDLQEEHVPFNHEIPVGIMVETPATVVMLDRFLREVDFISIGTNDLIQYALAVDRSNKEVADLYQASDPAVLRLINLTVQASLKASVPASLCGQMSGSAHYTMLLLGLGLRSLSVPPSAISEVKRVVRAVSIPQCEAVSRRALTMDSAREVDKFLQEELKKAVPELDD